MAQALAQVKLEFGNDAVIVRTRAVKSRGVLGVGGRKHFEVTAGRGEPAEKPNNVASSARRLSRMYAAGAAAAQPADNVSSEVKGPLGERHLAGRSAGRPTGGSVSRPVGLSTGRLPSASADRLASLQLPHEFNAQNGGAARRPLGGGVARVTPGYDAARGNNPVGTVPVARRAIVEEAMSEEVKAEITTIQELVKNLVKEQRQLHAPQMPEQLFDTYLDLIQREVADEIARELIADVQRDMTGNQIKNGSVVRNKIVNIMESMIGTAGPICRNLDGSARVVAVIGPTGVGKTTTIAKLAANFKLRQQKKVGLITIDTYRIGAVDQLRMYAQILDVPLKVVLTPGELKNAVAEMSDFDIVLIDTAGRAQTDKLKLKELRTFLEAAKPDETHLVLSTTAHHSHMLSAADEFKKIGVDRLILTKLDEAISFGVVLSVMRKMDASLSYVTTGQAVPDDIEVGSGKRLAQMLLGIEDLDVSEVSDTQAAGA